MAASLVVVYTRSHSIGGVLIRNADLSGRRWSHCGVCTRDNTVVEALAFKGVVETPWEEFQARYPGATQRAFKEVLCPDPDAGIAWARSQIGKSYDYPALLGLALRRSSWQHEDKWHCSELAETALVKAGKRRFLDSPSVISPNLSYMVISDAPLR